MTTTSKDQELNEQVRTLADFVINNLPTRDQVDSHFRGIDNRFTRLESTVAEVNAKVANVAVGVVAFREEMNERMGRLEGRFDILGGSTSWKVGSTSWKTGWILCKASWPLSLTVCRRAMERNHDHRNVPGRQPAFAGSSTG